LFRRARNAGRNAVFFAGKANLTVAADGSGDVRTLTEAIAKVPENNKTRFVISSKKGFIPNKSGFPQTNPLFH